MYIVINLLAFALWEHLRDNLHHEIPVDRVPCALRFGLCRRR
jgi:hypothetical protein